MGVAEIEFTIEEEGQSGNCSDVITCWFEGGGACGWSLGEHVTFINTQTNGLFSLLLKKNLITYCITTGIGISLDVSDSHSGGMVLSQQFLGDKYCRLSFRYVAQGVELVAVVSGVGVVWSSETNRDDHISTANFTFDLQESGEMDERNVTLFLGEVWNGNGTVLIFSPTLYPCTQCVLPPNDDGG